jgi:hypothetical protein
MIIHASSSLMAAGIRDTIPVPALPFLITQNSSPSFRFLWNLQLVKLRGARIEDRAGRAVALSFFPVAIEAGAFALIQCLALGNAFRG